MKRLVPVIGLAILVLMSNARSEDAPPGEDDNAMLSDQIAPNWNIDYAAWDRCAEEISLRLHLEPDGTVTKVEQMADLSTDACRYISDSARRAVAITRKLDFNGATIPPTMILRFNRPEW